MDNIGFYEGDYILTLGSPVVVIHVDRDAVAKKFVGDLFVLYPCARDRTLEWQHQRIDFKIDEEAVEYPFTPLTKKGVFKIAYERAKQLIDLKKKTIYDEQPVKAPQLLAETVLEKKKRKVLIDLWLLDFEEKALLGIRDRTRSPELKAFMMDVLKLPRMKFENPYQSSDELGGEQ